MICIFDPQDLSQRLQGTSQQFTKMVQ